MHKALSKVRTLRRVVLTGTPIQNNLMELYALVQWVRPHKLGTWAHFKGRFVDDILASQAKDADFRTIKRGKARMAVLHNELEVFTHRRKVRGEKGEEMSPLRPSALLRFFLFYNCYSTGSGSLTMALFWGSVLCGDQGDALGPAPSSQA